MEKEIKIVPPEGYIVDAENSTFECIKFKPKTVDYETVARELFLNKKKAYIPSSIKNASIGVNQYNYINSTNCTSKEQAKKLTAFNQLINVAKYLNKDWKPNFNDSTEAKYIILYRENEIIADCWYVNNFGIPYFKTKALAEQAIEILGEETIKLALSQV